MDTSKEYIEMCRKAIEIQELWEPTICDAWVHKEDLNVVYVWYEEFPHKDDETEKEARKRINNYLYFVKIGTWLPRQYQLQDIVFKPNYHLYSLVKEFSRWVNEDAFYQNTVWFSQEQLWLAFVMHEKYQKEWNGEDWV